MSVAILFDGNDVEQLDDLDSRPRQLNDTQLLWADVDRKPDNGGGAAKAFDLDERTAKYLELHTSVPCSLTTAGTSASRPMHRGATRMRAARCRVRGRRGWVITSHEQPIPVLDELLLGSQVGETEPSTALSSCGTPGMGARA